MSFALCVNGLCINNDIIEITMNLRKLLENTDIKCENLADIDIKGLSRNSMEIKDGFLFIASKGSKKDAKDFIPQAAQLGAVAAIADAEIKNAPIPCLYSENFEKTVSKISSKFYGHPSSSLYTIGITGTKGKTSVSYMLEKAFTDLAMNPSVIGTINYRTWKKILMDAPNTTPLEPLLSKILNDFKSEGCKSCIMEISSHALALSRADSVFFDAAIFTNLQSDHMDFHKTKDEYLNAKKKLFEMLSNSPKKDKIAIINRDDEKAMDIAASCLNGVKKVFYGFSKCDYMAEDIKESEDGTSFNLRTPGGDKYFFSLKLIGKHNVYNFLSVAALLFERGVSYEKIKTSLENFSSIPGRLERIKSSFGFSVFVDYAHTEESIKSALRALRSVGPKRIITVFGCGGDRDRTKRAPMGLSACSMSDFVIITSDNPRNEDPDSIINEIESQIKGRFSNYRRIVDRAQAIMEAIKMAQKGDFVLIAGKGHENYQIIGNEKIHFDDKEQAIISMKKVGKE